MSKFVIQSHGRLQEWVAEEHGYFRDEGLEYEFVIGKPASWSATVANTEDAPAELKRDCDVFGDPGDALPLERALKQRFDPAGILNPGRSAGRL